jgi:hypothetical protein
VPRRLLAAGLLLCCAATSAEELPEIGDTKIDEYHGLLVDSVSTAATWLDSFFRDENYLDEANTTSFRLETSSFTEAREGTEFKAKVRLRLRLPHLEDRLLLFVSGATEDFTTSGSDWEEFDDEITSSDEDSASVGLRYFFREDARSNTSLSGGVRFRSGSPLAYVRPRYRYLKRFPTFNLRFIQRVSLFTDGDIDARTQVQYERFFDRDWFFRNEARLDWYNDEEGLFPKLFFELSHRLSERRVLAAEWRNFFETEPNGVLDSSVLKLRYRQQTWRRWLWFEIAPQVKFPREDDYDFTPGIQVKLEARFERDS